MNSLETNNEMSYNVRWNSFGSEMRNILSGLLESGKGSDLRVICNGEKIKCHSFVLRGCSEYFNQLLSELEDKQAHSQTIVLQVDGVQFPELLDLINFMYKGEITVPVARLPLLIKSAQILKVKGLTDPGNFEWSSKNQCETSVTGIGHSPEEGRSRQEVFPSNSYSSSSTKKAKADEESLNDVNPSTEVMLQLQFLAYLNFAYRFLFSASTPSQPQPSFPNDYQLQLQQPTPSHPPLKPQGQRKRRQSNKLNNGVPLSKQKRNATNETNAATEKDSDILPETKSENTIGDGKAAS